MSVAKYTYLEFVSTTNSVNPIEINIQKIIIINQTSLNGYIDLTILCAG